VREREIKSVCVRVCVCVERERDISLIGLVCKRESECVCMCIEREREKGCMWERESVCIERERHFSYWLGF